MKRLYIVGIGPGEYEKMTIEAGRILEECDVIAGYGVYVDLVKDHLKDKEYLVTPMKQEKKRCQMALEAANEGKKTAMICSGDAGVYGMAGILMEMSVDYEDVELIVVPGVTAALSGSAVLGAAIGHDFAVISLSDLMTPWETITKRLQGAAMADFVIALYNPSSKKRSDYLKKACDILLEHKSADTICGYVKNIGRQGEEVCILTLKELRETQVDMFTTVFIGNAETRKIRDRMVTPRGYQIR